MKDLTYPYFGKKVSLAIRVALTPKVWMLLIPTLCFYGFFYVFPLFKLLSLSLFDPEFTLRHFINFIKVPAYWKVLLNTINISATVTLVCLIMGYPTAYFLANLKSKIANLLIIAVILPFFTSILIRTFSWIVLLGREGIINQLLINGGIINEPLHLIFNRFGVHVGMVHFLLPYAILIMHSVMKGIDSDLLRAAKSLGASGIQTFIMVYFPLSIPGVVGSGILIFIISLGFFVTPALLGGLTETMLAQFIEVQVHETVNWGFASALSIVLLLSTLFIFLISGKFLRLHQILGGEIDQEFVHSAFDEQRSNRKNNLSHFLNSIYTAVFLLLKKIIRSILPDQFAKCIKNLSTQLYMVIVKKEVKIGQLDVGNLLVSIIGIIVLIYLVFPVFINFPISFSSSKYFEFPPPGFSVEWYKIYFSSSDWIESTWFSLKVAFLATIFSTILGLFTSFGIVRGKFKGKHFLYGFVLSPVIVPVIIIAVSCYFLLANLGLTGTTIGLALSHSVVIIPITIVIITSNLVGFDQRLEQAALSLGAGRVRTFLSVTFPIIRPAIIIAALFAFIYSFDEVIIALFLSGIKGITLPVMIWNTIREDLNPTISAICSILVCITIILLVSVEILQRKSKARKDEV